MLGSYGTVLRAPGAAAFSLTGLVARLPLSMLGIGIVLLVQIRSGSYATAGAVTAAGVIGGAVGAPLQARVADRFGQRALLVPVALVHGVSLTAFLLAAAVDVGSVVLGALAAVAGGTLPQVGALVRARWSALATRPGVAGSGFRLHTAYSLEAVFDEVVFVCGPPLVTILTTAVNPYSGLGLTVAITVLGSLALAAQRCTEPVVQRHERAAVRDALPARTLLPLALAFVFLGTLFGTTEVVTVAYADEHGNRAVAGLLLAAFSFGSLLSGVIFGVIHWRSSGDRRFLIGLGALTVALSPLPFVGAEWLLPVVLFVAGFAISPTLITGNSLIATYVPSSRLTEGLAWVSTSLGAGVAVGSSVAGSVVDSSGANAGYYVALVAGVLATLVAAVRLFLLPAPSAAREKVGG